MFRPAKPKEEVTKPAGNPDNADVEDVVAAIKEALSKIRVTGGGAAYTWSPQVWGDVGILAQRSSRDLYVQLRHAEVEIDPRSIRALTSSDIVTAMQATRTSLMVQPEREDVTSFGGVASPNAAGVEIIAGVAGQKIKVYDAGYHAGADGLHYFYFGTTATPTTKRFCTLNKALAIHQTFIQPRVGAAGDALYIYSAVAETNMPYDMNVVRE